MIFYVPAKNDWIWTDRIKEYCHKIDEKIIIFNPGRNILSHFVNILRVYLLIIFYRKAKVIISFGSTNGFIASFFPFFKYTLILHGSDVLLGEAQNKRTRRAMKNAEKFYFSSAKTHMEKSVKMQSFQKFEWGLSRKELTLDIKPNAGNVITIAGTRHVRKHYCTKATIDVFHTLNKMLLNVKNIHFQGLPDQEELEQYKKLAEQKKLSIELIHNMPRAKFLDQLQKVDIGISLTKSDLYGGPILELLLFGGYVIVDSKHPILEIKKEYKLESIIDVKNFKHVDYCFDLESRKSRSKENRKFLKKTCFEDSMHEIFYDQ